MPVQKPQRKLLVTSVTGKQASGLIRSILTIPNNQTDENVSEDYEYHIYGITRHASPKVKQQLIRRLDIPESEACRLHLVQGDLNSQTSIQNVFATLNSIWGVFMVLPYPGLNKSAAGEEAQGRRIIDAASKSGIQSFVYSSAMRLPQYEEDEHLTSSAKAKINNENYLIRGNKDRKLPWTILQPGFFMENLVGSRRRSFEEPITVSVLRAGLNGETTISLVAAEDVGRLAAGVLKNPTPFLHSQYLVVSEYLTISEIRESHYQATGNKLPAAPTWIGWLAKTLSPPIRKDVIGGLEFNHKSRNTERQGDWVDIKTTKGIGRLQTYSEWAESRSFRHS